MREAWIQKAVLARLESWRGGVFWRNNAGRFKLEDGRGPARFVSFGVAGQADITGVAYGQRVEIEVKTPKGRLQENQKRFGEVMAQHGAAYFVVDCVTRGMFDKAKPGRWSIEEVIAKLEADHADRCQDLAGLDDLRREVKTLRVEARGKEESRNG